jgi:hypothetical protein
MRNFLYNKSDILAAAIIIIVAIIIIWSRIDAILNSDNVAAAKNPAQTGQEDTTLATDDVVVPADDNTVQPPDNNANANANENPPADEQTKALAAGEIVKFKVKSGMSSGDIATALKKAGLIASTDEFNKAVKKKKVEDRLQIGTFSIPAGSSIDKIIDMLTN